MHRQINRDGFASLEEGLQCMGKLDGVEVVPKSFIYSPVQNLSPYRERPQVVSQDVGSKKGPVTPRPQSSITPTSLAQLAAATGAGPGHGQRHRPLGATEASLTQTAGSMSVNPASPNPKLNSAFSTNDSSLVPNRQISRSGSDNQVLAGPSSMKSSTHSIAGSSSSYLGGGSSLLHLSISNPEDSLEMLGASLDLHQEEGDRERSSYRTDVEDKHGHDTYEEVDPDDDASTEEIAERGSIAMSSRPFRVRQHFPYFIFSHGRQREHE